MSADGPEGSVGRLGRPILKIRALGLARLRCNLWNVLAVDESEVVEMGQSNVLIAPSVINSVHSLQPWLPKHQCPHYCSSKRQLSYLDYLSHPKLEALYNLSSPPCFAFEWPNFALREHEVFLLSSNAF